MPKRCLVHLWHMCRSPDLGASTNAKLAARRKDVAHMLRSSAQTYSEALPREPAVLRMPSHAWGVMYTLLVVLMVVLYV